MPIAHTGVAAVIALLSTTPVPVAATPPPWARSGAHISAALERMLRDELAAGRPLPPDVIARWGLDRPELDQSAAAAAPEAVQSVQTQALAADALLNDRSGDVTCGACGNRPLSQGETTIAASGSFLLAGWNNSKGFCTGGPVQGWAWSVDGGGTWTDGGPLPSPIAGGRFRGDPCHAVNRSTGDFYVLGLYEDPLNGANSGISLIRGHFAGGTFVIDLNQRILAAGSTSVFLDKNWLAVDSLSGNVYVTYTYFDASDRIAIIRSTDRGVTWSAPQVLSPPASDGNVQGSRPAVGPHGEVYVVWYEYGFPLSHFRIRRSDDFGVTFGAQATVADYYENGLSGAPGFRRGFGVPFPSIAVDASPGPHRGRAYVSWDEAVDFYDAPFPASPTSISEVEVNDNHANATPFAIGNRLRGSMGSAADVDYFRFSGLRGQTVFLATDSASAGTSLDLRIVCSVDTSSFNNERSLALDRAQFAAVPFTLPADGVYYLRLATTSATVGNYRINTTLDTPTAGERARDHRDQFVAYSDGGATWSTPARLDDSDPWFDGEYPEITVDGTGAVHAFWHDFRDDPACGALSYEYMVSSGDGGVTWGGNCRVSDGQSFWSVNACGSANHGDYQGITSESNLVYPCWSDSRLGDPDAWSEADRFSYLPVCPAPQTAPGGQAVLVAFTITNGGNAGGTFAWSASDNLGRLAPPTSGTAAVPAVGGQTIPVLVHQSGDCWPAATDTVRITVTDTAIPGRSQTCVTTVTCTPTTAVGAPPAPLALGAPEPNPSAQGMRVAFSLAAAGAVRLAVLAATGARVRTLADGALGAGPHRVAWDGRDAAGRRVAPGAYFLRLETGGRTLTRPLTVVR
jgi:flagellar hook capping protein FlgD